MLLSVSLVASIRVLLMGMEQEVSSLSGSLLSSSFMFMFIFTFLFTFLFTFVFLFAFLFINSLVNSIDCLKAGRDAARALLATRITMPRG